MRKKSKGRGFVYAHANQRVKTKGDTLYRKCKSWHCSDGSVLTPQQNRPTADTCEVGLLEPCSGMALVPCRHSSFFFHTDAIRPTTTGNGCPIRRSPITVVLRLFNYSSLPCLLPFALWRRFFTSTFGCFVVLICCCANVKDVLE